MPALGRTVFQGESGQRYRFKVFPLGTRFRKLGGVFVIGSRPQGASQRRRIVPIFVGHTEDFSQPADLHLKAQDFTAQGANCICVQSDAVEESRRTKEQDLVAGLRPACNE